MADGATVLIYTSPGGAKTNLAVASDTSMITLESSWFDLNNSNTGVRGDQKKRWRRFRLECPNTPFILTIYGVNNLENTPWNDTYLISGNFAKTLMTPFFRYFKFKLTQSNPETRWKLTRLQLWGDLGGLLRDDAGSTITPEEEPSVFTGEITLTPGVANTTLSDTRIKAGSEIFLEPKTANAAGAVLVTFVQSVVDGGALLKHNISALTDRTFFYAVFN